MPYQSFEDIKTVSLTGYGSVAPMPYQGLSAYHSARLNTCTFVVLFGLPINPAGYPR